MTVKELIVLLEKEDQDATVILSKDGEGNQYSYLCEPFERGKFNAVSTWEVEPIHPDDLAWHIEEEHHTQDEIDAMPNGVIFFPVN